MGVCIVSVALWLDGRHALGRVWLIAAIAAFVIIAVLIVIGAATDGDRLLADGAEPSSLAAVAATAVVGSALELQGLRTVPIVLLVVASLLELGLGIALLRGGRLPRTGSSFTVTVSLQSVAVLAAVTASDQRTTWLVYPALGLWIAGLALYPIVWGRFDHRELLRGAGDHWVAGGALAISALAAGSIAIALRQRRQLHVIAQILPTVAAVIWAASIVWLTVLIAAEIAAPRLRYDVRRWATLFPLGMYAASGFVVARADGFDLAHGFAAAWTWVAAALSLIIAVGAVRDARLLGGAERE